VRQHVFGRPAIASLRTIVYAMSVTQQALATELVADWTILGREGIDYQDVERNIDGIIAKGLEESEKAAAVAIERVEALNRSVDDLELATWRRPDAVEDMGSAAKT
jgi:hypothetical protein